MSTRVLQTQYAVITILGISFWFFAAFPFENQNESYRWMALLNRMGLQDMFARQLETVQTYRPLGQAVAWIGYRLGNQSIYPVEVFNYVVAAAAWLILYVSVEEKRLLGVVGLVVGGLLFPGYIYLFHLHGVFYSPALLVIATAFWCLHRRPWSTRVVCFIAISVVASLFHPFAGMAGVAFVVGLVVDSELRHGKAAWVAVCVVMASLVALLVALAVNWSLTRMLFSLGVQHLNGFLVSYKLMELNPAVSVVLLVLSAGTAASVGIRYTYRIWLIVVSIALSVVCAIAGQPLAFTWMLMCLIKTLALRSAGLACLLLATAVFPIFTGTGTPTYAIFVLMVCSGVTATSWPRLDYRLRVLDGRLAPVVVVTAILALVGLRTGMNIPVVSSAAAPILAEKEKTFQMRAIVEWFSESQYGEYSLELGQTTGSPVDSDNVVNRTYRPPTMQGYLSTYVDSLRTREASSGQKLVVYFGGATVTDAPVVHTVAGKYAGDATVYLITGT